MKNADYEVALVLAVARRLFARGVIKWAIRTWYKRNSYRTSDKHEILLRGEASIYNASEAAKLSSCRMCAEGAIYFASGMVSKKLKGDPLHVAAEAIIALDAEVPTFSTISFNDTRSKKVEDLFPYFDEAIKNASERAAKTAKKR